MAAAASWLLIAALTNIDGNAMPILFQFQQYFLSCALFGLGLGFFHTPEAPQSGGQQTQSAKITEIAEAAQETDTTCSDKQNPSSASMGSGWAAWLAVIMLLLLWVVSTNYPGGLANAMSLSLQDESVEVFMSEFDTGRMGADIISVGLFGTMLFVWVQIFVGPGKQLKRLCADISPALALSLFRRRRCSCLGSLRRSDLALPATSFLSC